MMAVATMPTTIVVPMTMAEAIGETWLAIRHRNPDVPAATLSVVPGRGPADDSADWDSPAPVLVVGSSTVAQGAEAILGHLLHQAAHSLVRIRYAGSEGRYHGEGYREAAASLGLEVREVKGNGWAATSLGNGLAEEYDAHLRQLRAAVADIPPGRQRGKIPVHCQCPRRFVITPSVLEKGTIRCEICGQPFTP